MTRKRTAIKGIHLERGGMIRDCEISKVTLDNCSTASGPADDQRPLLENLYVHDVRLLNCSFSGAVVRDVTIENIRPDRFSMFLRGNEYERVTIRGRIGELILAVSHNLLYNEAEFIQRLSDADRGSGWSLDLSEVEGEIDIRGYDADRIRINPETQAVIRREDVLDGRWRELELDESLFAVGIQFMIDYGWPNNILSVNTVSPRGAIQYRALQRLRDEGIIR